jgi:hypothetical protein
MVRENQLMALRTAIDARQFRLLSTLGIRHARSWRARGAIALCSLGLGGHQHLPAPDLPTYTLTVATRQLVDLLRGQLFTDSGRFVPCRINPACSAWGRDIALSAPNISIDGPRVVFSVHLVGTYAMSQFFATTVTGDLIVSGIPTLRGSKVVLTQSSAVAGPTSDLVFRAFLDAAHPRIESMLEQSKGFDLPQYLAFAASDPALPPPRLPGTSCVDPSQIQVQSVSTQPSASALSAVVSVSPPPPGKCGAP